MGAKMNCVHLGYYLYLLIDMYDVGLFGLVILQERLGVHMVYKYLYIYDMGTKMNKVHLGSYEFTHYMPVL
jgi:hypothetical protein